MPIDDGSGVNVGSICEGCIHLRPMDGVPSCPYGNSQWPDKKLFFVGEDSTPGSKCHVYKTYDDIGIEAKSNSIKKNASKMSDSELNVSLYRKVLALDEKNQKKLYNYWDFLFPSDYAEDMVTDTNESGPKNKPHKRKKKRERNVFDDGFKSKNKGE